MIFFWTTVFILLWTASPQAQEPTETTPELDDPGIESFVPESEESEEEPFVETDSMPLDAETESFPAPEGSTPDMGAPPEIYVIQAGDTLWDICEKFLGNPWYWPKLWALNQYIENPHLIYPGNEIRFYGGSAIAPPALDIVGADEKESDLLAEAPGVEEPQEKPEPREVPKEGSKEEEPEDEKIAIKLKNLFFISEKELTTAGKITHSGEPKENLAAGDRVYLKFKKGHKVSVGSRFHVIEPIKKVPDPNKIFGNLGMLVKRKAIIEVLAIHKNTIEGMITDNHNLVQRDDRLVPYQSTVRLLIPHLSNRNVEGRIVEAHNQQFLISNQDFVFLNLGKYHGMDDGTQLMVVRRGDGVFQGDDRHLPDVVVGRLIIVEARNKTSTAYVTSLRDSLEIGDRVVSKLN